ncbi:MAG: ABC transporter ATP-binding protein, partial [Rhizobiales bacterium]|nr:ABC transporter ATP-binding protein [Hyphomicrobiales bacterium]
GKSMTGLAIPALLPPGASFARGSIRFHGEELTRAGPRRLAEIRGLGIGMIFQNPMTSFNPLKRVGAQVAEPLLLHGKADRRTARARVEDIFRQVSIPDPAARARAYPNEFSGGMLQRAMIATALVNSPELVIADEPTTALDVTVQAQVLDLLGRLNRETGAAMIFISHDLAVVSRICDRVAVMYAGRIVEQGPVRAILDRPRHPYSRALIAAMPAANAAANARLQTIGGEPPDFGALPSGCPFHPRCPLASERCRVEDPPLVADSEGRAVACWHADAVPPVGTGPVAATAAPSDVSATAAEPILRVSDLVRHFRLPAALPFGRRREVHALDGVSVTLARGDTLGIAGETGCGKSTLARCILRLVDTDSGSIQFMGEDITGIAGRSLRAVRRHIQPIFQNPYAALNPRARIEDIIAEPLRAFRLPAVEIDRRIDAVLDMVGMSPRHRKRLPHEFSGGQRQRISIARAIALRPALVVADEPIASLDVSIQAQIINLFTDLRREIGFSMIFISHDLRVIRHFCSHVAVMFLGQVVEHGPAAEVCARPRHPYTAALLSAVPELDKADGKPVILAGEPPSPLAPPSGCRFRTRCFRATERCAEFVPPLVRDAGGRATACFYPLETPAPLAAVPAS